MSYLVIKENASFGIKCNYYTKSSFYISMNGSFIYDRIQSNRNWIIWIPEFLFNILYKKGYIRQSRYISPYQFKLKIKNYV